MAEKKPAPKGGQQKAKKAGRKQSALYNFSGEKIERKRKSCPKCGPGKFMGEHQNRIVCGKCQYTEFVKKA